jgi:hypothetical protein
VVEDDDLVARIDNLKRILDALRPHLPKNGDEVRRMREARKEKKKDAHTR